MPRTTGPSQGRWKLWGARHGGSRGRPGEARERSPAKSWTRLWPASP